MTDLASEAGAFNAALKEEVPSIGKPESLYVELQRGIMDPSSGLWQTSAEVRELTGEDEEFLAALEADKGMTYSKYMTALVARATSRIGNKMVSNSQSIIQELIPSDRDLLFLGIIRATYGPERTFIRLCEFCEKPNDVTINLVEDFPVSAPTFNVHEPLEIALRKGSSLRVRLPNGNDNFYVSKNAKTTAEQSTLLISRCVIWDEGQAPSDPIIWAKALSLADRNKIIKAILNVELGPKMQEVNTQCAHCGETMNVVIDWVSLLLG